MSASTWPYAAAAFAAPGLPLLAMMAAWVLRERFRRAAMGLFWGAASGLWLLCTPAVASHLIRFVEAHAERFDEAAARAAQAVVVLAGDRARYAPEYLAEFADADGTALAGATLMRLHYGVTLAKRLNKPLIVTGGGGLSDKLALADLMRQAASVYGVVPLALERVSLTTRDHPAGVRAAAPQIQHIILVTSASHLARSTSVFRAAGFTVVPAPTAFADRNLHPQFQWLPSPDALRVSNTALREAVGLLRGY